MVEKSRRTGRREVRHYAIARVQVNNIESLKWDSGKEGADSERAKADDKLCLVSGQM